MLAKIKAYLLIVLLVASIVFLVQRTGASDASLNCGNSGCLGINGAIFNEGNLAPGTHISKTLNVTNNYAENRNFAVEVVGANFSDSSPSLADKLTVTIKDNSSSSIIYGPNSLSGWKSDGLIKLSEVPSGGSKEYLFEVDFADVGNDFQGKTLSFDLNLGFEAVGGATASTTNSSGPGVLGASTGNSLGNVLGLSATGGKVWFSILIILGIILLLLGTILILTTRKRTLKTGFT